jgi:hypothetical protein
MKHGAQRRIIQQTLLTLQESHHQQLHQLKPHHDIITIQQMRSWILI